MNDFLSDIGLTVPPGDPEPDPRDDPMKWISWFRGLVPCPLSLARNAVKRRIE